MKIVKCFSPVLIFSLLLLVNSCTQPIQTTSITTGNNTTSADISQNTKPTSKTNPPNSISVEEAEGILELGSVILVDVRNKANFETGHIKDALSIPVEELETNLDIIPKDKQVIVYSGCS